MSKGYRRDRHTGLQGQHIRERFTPPPPAAPAPSSDAATLVCPWGHLCRGPQPLPVRVLWLVVHAPGMMFGLIVTALQQEHHACMQIPTTTGCMRASVSQPGQRVLFRGVRAYPSTPQASTSA